MSTGAAPHIEVAVVGAGVVGCAVALALARRGVSLAVLEAEAEPGLAASGTNSGILHTGFDSNPGELETEMILASGALREPLLAALGIPVLRCGALMRAGQAAGRIAGRARENGVQVRLRDGAVEIPGESVTDPVAYTLSLATEAGRQGAQVLTGFRVEAIEASGGLRLVSADGVSLRAGVVVNCAGLQADGIARLVGDDSFSIYPRKGEFLVFEAPGELPLEHILLPVPTERTKGVLVFPTLDGKVVAGPTAVDLEDKDDWSVRPAAIEELVPAAATMYPPLEGAEPIAAYAGLRPAGRGINYVIGVSAACSRLVNVAAVRSTGLTASLGIAQRVVELVQAIGVPLGPERELRGGPAPAFQGPWWQRTASYRVGVG